MHPGILPQNRGLDNLKWGILKGYEQGVTSHLIDAKIDRGLLIEKETISVYEDDTLVDLHVRIQNLEQKIMISSIKKLENEGKENLLVLPEGNYYKSVTPDLEEILMQKFELYKKEK